MSETRPRETDLNIHNYSYPDLLRLFNIPSIEKPHLKRAYKITMMTHPDRSGLPKDYFLFFVKAYRILHTIANQEQKRETNIYDTTVPPVDVAIINDFISSPDFNTRFNKQFEALDIQDEDQQSGYENWLRNTDNKPVSRKPANVRDMNNLLEQEREKQIQHFGKTNAIVTIGDNSSYDLLRKRTPYYDSDIFSSLPYQDLKKAHEESLIRVHPDDGLKHMHMNMNTYQKKRHDLPSTFHTSEPNTEEQIQHSFELAKQEEHQKRIRKSWWSSFQQITNS
jgi:hypothetical protein